MRAVRCGASAKAEDRSDGGARQLLAPVIGDRKCADGRGSCGALAAAAATRRGRRVPIARKMRGGWLQPRNRNAERFAASDAAETD